MPIRIAARASARSELFIIDRNSARATASCNAALGVVSVAFMLEPPELFEKVVVAVRVLGTVPDKYTWSYVTK